MKARGDSVSNDHNACEWKVELSNDAIMWRVRKKSKMTSRFLSGALV